MLGFEQLPNKTWVQRTAQLIHTHGIGTQTSPNTRQGGAAEANGNIQQTSFGPAGSNATGAICNAGFPDDEPMRRPVQPVPNSAWIPMAINAYHSTTEIREHADSIVAPFGIRIWQRVHKATKTTEESKKDKRTEWYYDLVCDWIKKGTCKFRLRFLQQPNKSWVMGKTQFIHARTCPHRARAASEEPSKP